jgi:hypothetical protein
MVTKEECYVSKESADKLFEVLGIDVVDGKLIYLRDRLKDVGFNKLRHPDPQEWIVHNNIYSYLWDPWDYKYRTYFRQVGIINEKKISFDKSRRNYISENEYTLDPGTFNTIDQQMKEDSISFKRLWYIDSQVKSGKLTVTEALAIPRTSINVDETSSWDME